MSFYSSSLYEYDDTKKKAKEVQKNNEHTAFYTSLSSLSSSSLPPAPPLSLSSLSSSSSSLLTDNDATCRALIVRDLSVHYGFLPVLWDICVDIPQATIVGIMGPNGAGKSTFMKAILDLIPSTGNKEILGKNDLAKVCHKIAYVPQKENIDWDFPMTVQDLIVMGCYPKKGLFRRITKEEYKSVEAAMDLMGLIPYAHRQISQLSGGQQQRAFIARALVQNASVYFLDEPFAGVDLTSEKIIIDVLRRLRSDGKTIFVVHHDLSSAESYFDWLILLNTRLVACGPVSEIFNKNNLRLTYGRNWKLVEDVMQASFEKQEGVVS